MTWNTTNNAWATTPTQSSPSKNNLGVAPVRWGTRYFRPPKCKTIPESRLKFQFAQEMAQALEIVPDCKYFTFVDGTFIAGDLIEAIITEKCLRVCRLTISTLSLSENNVDSLALLLQNGHVDSLDLIVSDYFFAHERRNLIPYIYQELDHDDKFQLAVAATHCKLALIETHCGMKIVLHGSANLRSASCMEQIVVEENPGLYDFIMDAQQKIIDAYSTIRKSIRTNSNPVFSCPAADQQSEIPKRRKPGKADHQRPKKETQNQKNPKIHLKAGGKVQ